LTPESNVEHLKEMTDNAGQVLSIVDSKGLEFMEVVIVDFFSSVPVSDREHWKRLFTLKPDEPLGDFPHPQIESQLKKLYVAITRARNRLVFIETGLFDVNGNGRAFELVQAVWKSWSGIGTKDTPADSLPNFIENFAPDFSNAVIQQSDYELFASALNFIQRVLKTNTNLCY
jgi:ATP-dependent exoDNAse (exonuclease V) beta subunit